MRHPISTHAFSGSLLMVCLALIGCLQGCRQAPPAVEYQVTYDLLRELPAAGLLAEIDGIDFGTRPVRPFLIDGFSADEFEQRLKRPYVWGVGSSSVVDWPILERRDAQLLLEVRPHHYPQAPPQGIEIHLNDTLVGQIELRRRVKTYPIALPATAQVVGANRLRFDFRWSQQPLAEANGIVDGRDLAVAFFTLKWADASPIAAAKPQVDQGSGRLFLPQGLRLDFLLALDGPSQLAVEQWNFRGQTSRLRLSMQEDGKPVQPLADLQEPPKGPVKLPGDGQRIVQLTVESLRTESPTPDDNNASRDPNDDPTSPPSTYDPQHGVVWLRPGIESAVQTAPTATATATAAAPVPEPASGTKAATTRPTDSVTSTTAQPNVVIYMIDTLRADHLGAYGYQRPTSPHLDALAEEAILFENFIAQSSWTRSSIASLMTGLWPVAHGTNLRDEVLSDDAVTLPELLRQEGYQTAAFFSNPNVSGPFGFTQGFDSSVDLSGSDVDATVIQQEVYSWFEQRQADSATMEAPYFLYIHTIDPHSPYDPPAPYRDRFAPQVAPDIQWTPNRMPRRVRRGRVEASQEQMDEMIGLYDAEIATNDAAFGELRAFLEGLGSFDDTLLIVVSDHGEEFFEHGHLEHGKNLYAETLRVPLIIKPPGQPGIDFAPHRVADVVQHIDLLPTLARLLNLEGTNPWQGRDLSGLWHEGEGLAPQPRVYSYLHLDGEPKISVVDGEWKLIQRIDDDRLLAPRLFHLPSDPQELQEVGAEHPIRRGYLKSLLHKRLQSPEGRLESLTLELDENLRQRLEALGYLQ